MKWNVWGGVVLIGLYHAAFALFPMSIRTTPRRNAYEISVTAPSNSKVTYYELRVLIVNPKKCALRQDMMRDIGVVLDDKMQKGMIYNVSSVDLKKSKVIRSDQYRFVVPAGVKVKQTLRFLSPPKNERLFYTFESTGKFAQSKRAKDNDKATMSLKMDVKVRVLGYMYPAKPKPYPKFRVKEKNGRLYFRNTSSRYSMAYLSCKNNDGKEMTYRILVPSNKKAVNKRAMSWDLKGFIQQKRSQKNTSQFSCQAVYYKRLGADKNSTRKKLLTL